MFLNEKREFTGNYKKTKSKLVYIIMLKLAENICEQRGKQGVEITTL